jgi:hypothetical protein
VLPIHVGLEENALQYLLQQERKFGKSDLDLLRKDIVCVVKREKSFGMILFAVIGDLLEVVEVMQLAI